MKIRTTTSCLSTNWRTSPSCASRPRRRTRGSAPTGHAAALERRAELANRQHPFQRDSSTRCAPPNANTRQWRARMEGVAAPLRSRHACVSEVFQGARTITPLGGARHVGHDREGVITTRPKRTWPATRSPGTTSAPLSSPDFFDARVPLAAAERQRRRRWWRRLEEPLRRPGGRRAGEAKGRRGSSLRLTS